MVWLCLVLMQTFGVGSGDPPAFADQQKRGTGPLRFRLDGVDPIGEGESTQPLQPDLRFRSLLWQDARDILIAPLDWRGERAREMRYLIAGLVAVYGVDDSITGFARDRGGPAVDIASKQVGRFGEEYSFATLAAFYLSGKIFRDEKSLHVAKDGLIASVIAAGVVTPLIKQIGGRVRPRDQDNGPEFRPLSGNHSFPSGHTTQAFAVATVIAEHYPNRWARGVSYSLATLVGMSRVQEGAHYASDVAAGAAIGFMVGRKVVRLNMGKRDRVVIDPMVYDGYLGVRVRVPQDRRQLRWLRSN